MRLHVLGPEGRRLVTSDLASGAVDRWSDEAWRPLATQHPRAIELDALDLHLARTVRDHAPYDPTIDATLAPLVHRALPLTRREAAEPGVWRFLAVVHAPQLVRHRWESLSWATTKTRYWSIGTRHTSNAFARWWWIAELTREGDSYELTERALARTGLATQVFVRSWSQHRPAVRAFVEALEDAPGEIVERAARELSRRLALVPLEVLDDEPLRAMVRACAEMRRG